MKDLLANRSPFLVWLVYTGLIAYALFVLWRFGLLNELFENDPSRVSSIILCLFVATQIHAGYLAFCLHGDRTRFAAFIDHQSGPVLAGAPPTAVDPDDRLIQLLVTKSTGSGDSAEYLKQLLHNRLSSGWFLADLMFKLGLIGTVIGFIFMLAAISDLKSLDIHQARAMLGEMSGGMRLALYTTLTGLAGGALTGIQVHFLERSTLALETEVLRYLTGRQIPNDA